MLKHSFLSPKVKVGRSKINKQGIFACQRIKKDEVIAVWGGHIITEKEFNQLLRGRFKKLNDYATKIADGFYLVSNRDGTLEDDDFFNHSCSPNAGIKGQLMMVAMRDIEKGEEITYDYAMTDAGYNYSFRCQCGSPECRKIITTHDWRDKRLQKKYKGYFSWYVQKKIDQWNARIRKRDRILSHR